MNSFDLSIKDFLKEKMYYSSGVLKNTNKGKKIIKSLFININRKPSRYLNDYNKKNKVRSICDFIAGMTDRFAIDLYNSIK